MSENKDFIIESGTLKKYVGQGGEVVIPDGVSHIDYFAFKNCSNITELILPESLRACGFELSEMAGLRCNEYDNAYYLGTASNPYFLLLKVKSKDIVSCEIHKDTTVIGAGAFFRCEKLEELIIPDNVRYIDASICFYANIKRLSIGAGVRVLGSCAFNNCYFLEEIIYNAAEAEDLSKYANLFLGAGKNGKGIKVVIGASVRRVPAYLFCLRNESKEEIPRILSLEFEAGSICESIGECAFESLGEMSVVNLGESLKVIETCAFCYCHEIKNLTIPDSLKRIETRAFSNCSYLTNLKLGSSVEFIGDAAFFGCMLLKELVIPDSVREIGLAAFKDCTYLEKAALGNGLCAIAPNAFENCHRMTTVEISASICEIGTEAFKYCSSLKSANFEDKRGWSVEGVEINPDALNGQEAAENLRNTYSNKVWKKS